MISRLFIQGALLQQARSLASKSGKSSGSSGSTKAALDSALEKSKEMLSDTSARLKAAVLNKPTTEQKVADSAKNLADKASKKVGAVRDRAGALNKARKDKVDAIRDGVAEKIHSVGRKVSKK